MGESVLFETEIKENKQFVRYSRQGTSFRAPGDACNCFLACSQKAHMQMWVINLGEQSCWIKASMCGWRKTSWNKCPPATCSPDEPSASALDTVWWAVYNDAITAAHLNKAAPSQLGRWLLTGLMQSIVSTLFTRVLCFARCPFRHVYHGLSFAADTLAGWSSVSCAF